MAEQIITTREVLTLGDFRRATVTVPDCMPLRDYVKRAGLQVTLLETDQGRVLEVS